MNVPSQPKRRGSLTLLCVFLVLLLLAAAGRAPVLPAASQLMTDSSAPIWAASLSMLPGMKG
ncbi:MAG: hypothetical protein II650_08220, partial [Clostridia bacterium]|nr:hypothetical protein [Clostridia bacterium]